MSDANKHGHFCWNELATRDVDGAKKFYTDLLGWTTEDSPMDNMTYTVFKSGDEMVGGMFAMCDEMKDLPPHWMSYITVDDVDASAAKVKELGGTVCVEPTDIPTVGRFCVINDPTGGAVSLITMEKK